MSQETRTSVDYFEVGKLYSNDEIFTSLAVGNAGGLRIKTGKDGKFKISNIPAGKYTFVAWQPSGASEKRGIAIVDGKTININFEVEESVFSIKHKNKYGRAYDKEYKLFLAGALAGEPQPKDSHRDRYDRSDSFFGFAALH